MRIATKLNLAAWAPVLMALISGCALFASSRVVEEARAKSLTARQIIDGTNELNSLAGAYLLYHEERPRLQFVQQHEAIARLVAATRFRDRRQQELLNGIGQNSRLMKDSFLRLVANHERRGDSTGGNALAGEAEERLAGQILTRSRAVLSEALRLESLIDEEITAAQRRVSALILFLIVVVTFPLTVVLIRMARNIASSLRTLRRGAELIGAGQLDHRIALAARDELGELARAFDRMTAQLQETTVSRDSLGREVQERRRAEQALAQAHEELQVSAEELAQQNEELLGAQEHILQLNRDLQRTVADLQRANRELETFNYSVSHDLKSPLSVLDGYSHLLLEDCAGQLDENGRRFVLIIRETVRKLHALTEGLLAISRIGRQAVRQDRIDMADLALDVAEELRALPGNGSVEVEVGALPEVQGDARMVRQILVNLMGNAMKFSRHREQPRIVVTGELDNGGGVFHVRDNGVGFDMQYADKLFGVFQRLHCADEFEGTGLGLAIVQRIVERHGGAVWAEAKPGEGATFSFTLPAAASVAAPVL